MNIRLTPIDSEKDAMTEAEWTNDRDYARSLKSDTSRPFSAYELRQYYDDLLKKANDQGNQFYFAIRPCQNNTLIGFVRITRVDWHHGAAYLQLSFGNPEKLHDYGIEVLELALGYIFNELNLHRVSAVVPEFDENLLTLFQQSGFNLEVHQRQAIYRQANYADRVYLGLLREKWHHLPGTVH
jgi:RimJ/RimL family protein N-acetyltransferase